MSSASDRYGPAKSNESSANAGDAAAPRVGETAAGLSLPSERSYAAPAASGLGGEKAIGQLLRNIANYAGFTTDTAGRIAEWNQEAGRLFGYDEAEIFGKHLSLVCVEDSARTLQKIFEQAKEQQSSRYYQWMTRKDGERFYARVVVFALRDDTEVQGFLFLLRDDSRDPNLRQIWREKEQMAAIGTAASILAHEIGNPLNGISATVQLLEHCLSRPTLPTAASMLSSVHDLKSEVKRLTELLSEFKNIAWPQKLALGPVDIKRLIQRLVGEIEKRSLRQNVEVSVQCQAELPLLNGDDDKLKQALHNVLDNALDAMPHGGRLEIKAYQHEQTICIDILDTGAGIPKNLKVFDLFSSTKADGIGLGLFLVQQIVLAHDGAITYSSTPGQGTTFHVTFALNPAPDPFGVDFIDLI
jgi:PAS domain S-box-containing protein